MSIIEEWFPDDPTTQAFAKAVVESLASGNLDIPLNKETIGALIQTFARGEAFSNMDKFKSDVLFHFTYERDPARAQQVGIVNPNAEAEINAVQGDENKGTFTFDISEDAWRPANILSGRRSGGLVGGGLEGGSDVISRPTDGAEGRIPGLGDSPDLASGILGGGRLVQVHGENGIQLFMQVYDLPDGSGVSVYYDYLDADQVQKTFGAGWQEQVTFMSFAEFSDGLGKGLMIQGGEASELRGMVGNYNSMYQLIRQQALLAAGINDPALQGALMNDPEIANIIVRAAIQKLDPTGAQVKAELRQTNYWRNVLYPGIDVFYNQGVKEPEQAWRRYSDSISDGLRQLGIGGWEAGDRRHEVAKFLRAGVSDVEFNTFLPIAKRVQNNPDLKRNLDAWAIHELGRPLNFNEFFDVLTGTNDAELDRIIESATLAFSAERAGVNISVADIRKIAEQTDLSEAGAIQAFTEQDRAILAIGNQDLAGYGITRGDILDAAVGATPRSGQSRAEIMNLTSKLATERGISDDPNARFFQGLNFAGQPVRTGLRALAPEGG